MSEPTFRRGKHLFGREAELRKQILSVVSAKAPSLPPADAAGVS
jgi:hypothetical protein